MNGSACGLAVLPRHLCKPGKMLTLCSGLAGAWLAPLSCSPCALQVVQVAKWHGRMIVRLMQPDRHAAWVDLQELAANAACITIVQVSNSLCDSLPAQLHVLTAHTASAPAACGCCHSACLRAWPNGPDCISTSHPVRSAVGWLVLPHVLPVGTALRRSLFISWPPKTPSCLSLTG